MQHYLVKDISHYCNVTKSMYGSLLERPIPYYDFSFILEGSMVYYADGIKIPLEQNDAIFSAARNHQDSGTGAGYRTLCQL